MNLNLEQLRAQVNDVFAEMDTQLPGITRVLLAISDFSWAGGGCFC